MKSYLTLLALLIATPAIAQHKPDRLEELSRAGNEYRDCLVSETVKLGKANQEPGGTVYEAAISSCQASRGLIVAVAFSRWNPSEAMGASSGMSDTVERQTRPDALLALMRSRSGD